MGHRHSRASASASSNGTLQQEHDDEDYIELEFELGHASGRRRARRKAVHVSKAISQSTRSGSSSSRLKRSKAAALSLGLCRALASVPLRGLAAALRVAGTTARYGVAAGLCAFLPKTSKVLGVLAALSRKRVLGLATPLWTQRLLRPLHPLSGPFLVHGCMWAVMPLVLPSLWRSLMYWQRSTPVVTSYFVTGVRVDRAQRRLDSGKSVKSTPEQLWQAQHEAAADRLFEMLADLKGFYLKLGQILATKTDMLPAPYTASLSRLLDRMPATPFSKVQRSIERELGGKLSAFFSYVDPFPLASATVAQVHQARLSSGSDVVVKVQHSGTKRTMGSDLANMRLACAAMDALKVNLGFDLSSVVYEYCEQVPLEFDFEREAAMAESVRSTLLEHSQHFPLLRQVIIPEMLLFLSTPRLLTMQHVDGVPLLDIAGMDLEIKTQLMASLVLAYGIMILRGGTFHSDPHPGNLLACCSNSTDFSEPDIKVAILDWGQVKQLSDESRLRYALLVSALASREEGLLVATMRELGLVVENCSVEFEAIAGYILFDTRMDFPEAQQSPLDPNANEGWRTAKVPTLPQDLFMIVRVITLLRGVMHSLGVDISSALMWRPLALQTIAELSQQRVSLTPPPSTPSTPQGAGREAAWQGEEERQERARQRAELAAQTPPKGGGGQGLLSPRVGTVSPRWSWTSPQEAAGRGYSPRGSVGDGGSAGGARRSSSPQAVAAAELAAFLASQQQQQQQQQQQEGLADAPLAAQIQSVELLS